MVPLTRAQLLQAEQPAAHDPADLGPYLLCNILSFLPPEELLTAALVSRGWHEAASQPGPWRAHCEAAWESLVYVPLAARTDLSWKQRYLAAEADLQRTAITEEELTTFRWRFRFKATAGEWWTALDPWHASGGRLWLERLFLLDGRTAPGNDLWDGLVAAVGQHEFRWRLTKTQSGRRGCFVKIHTFPSLDLTRLPDGGWLMENVWVKYEASLAPGGPYCRGIPPGAHRYLR